MKIVTLDRILYPEALGFTHATWVLCHQATFLDHLDYGYAREQPWFLTISTELLHGKWVLYL